MTKAGFKIGDDTYPIPDSFGLGDAVLIEILTGMSLEEFGYALLESGDNPPTRVVIGLVGVAVWRSHPRWDVTRAARFVQSVDLESLDFEPGDAEEESGPPAEGAGASEQNGSGLSEPAPTSTSEPDSVPDEQTPNPSGHPYLATPSA